MANSENESIACCLGGVAHHATSSLVPNGLSLPLPALDDEEGASVPSDLPPVIDAHVHVFPERIARAIWAWFDEYGWPIRYKILADEVITHLLTRGVSHLVLLHYAHKPGIARSMNAFVAELVAKHGAKVTGLATVHPGEADQVEVLSDAFAHGLKGVKLHCHVQAMPADDARLFPVYELCAARGLPVVIHAGREPKSAALPVDPYTICDASRVERVLRQFPALKLCVPHLGVDELEPYAELLRRFDNLWLDTTMMLGSYFITGDVMPYLRARPDRVLFGTDFPHLPYAWDREARAVSRMGLPDADVELLLARAHAVWHLLNAGCSRGDRRVDETVRAVLHLERGLLPGCSSLSSMMMKTSCCSRGGPSRRAATRSRPRALRSASSIASRA